MIYVIIGTMGEYTKMFPVMYFLQKHNIAYKFVHTCQHYEIIERIRKKLGGREPDYYLTLKKKDLANIWEFLIWAPQVLLNARKLPITKNDFVVVHGDAESTLLGLIIGILFRAKIVHVEAGLRTHSIFEPFPEEIVRTIADRFSNVCFPTYQQNVKNIKGSKEIYVTEGNTIFDTIKKALEINPSAKINSLSKKKYVMFTIHRKENSMVKKRLIVILDILEMILKKGFIVIWPLHSNAMYELQSKGLIKRVQELQEKYNLQTNKFFDYVDLMHAIKNCQFVASDSGGVQTETYFLNKPMLIMRKRTEIIEGLGETAFLSQLDKKKVDFFLNNYNTFKRKKEIKESPSKIVTDYFQQFAVLENEN